MNEHHFPGRDYFQTNNTPKHNMLQKCKHTYYNLDIITGAHEFYYNKNLISSVYYISSTAIIFCNFLEVYTSLFKYNWI